MKHDMSSKIVYLTLIVGRKKKDAILTAILEAGARATNVMYARGSVNESLLGNMLGFVPEEHKVVITCIISDAKADLVLDMLVDRFHFDRPNTGIAYTTAIDHLSY